MRTVINDKEIVVNFQYSKPLTGKARKKHDSHLKCIILEGPIGTLDHQKEKIGEAEVRRDSRDQSNWVAARRIVLAKALAHTKLSGDEVESLWDSLPLRKTTVATIDALKAIFA